jgi:predicted fused transcriptional regulator/phosphomethylpyrimidine kinase
MQTREGVSEALREAASLIAAEADPRLNPEGGIRMGYALPGAATQNDVCTTDSNTTSVRFGADPGVARAILTIIRHEGCLRSVAAVRCTKEILRCITDDLVLDVSSYSYAPPGSGTMDWGVESCCRAGVPDVIYRQKTAKKEPLLWIVAETPADVARNIIMLSGCISYTSL